MLKVKLLKLEAVFHLRRVMLYCFFFVSYSRHEVVKTLIQLCFLLAV